MLLWSQIRPNWTEKRSNNPVGDQNCLKNDCVKTVFFNSVFEIFVLKVCVLKQFQKITVYVENVDFRKTHQACVYHEGNGYFGVFVHVWSDASLFNMAFQMLDYENSASDADISQNSKI